MADINNLTNFLNDVADAIKTKKGYQSSQKIPAANFDTEINNIITVNNQNKTVNPSTSQQIVTPDALYTGLGQVTINAVTNSIDANITPQNIVNGVNILGVVGNYDVPLTNIDIAPSVNIQNITAPQGTGYNVINISAVTASIDSNIQANYIANGINILGVTGTLQEGEMSEQDYEEALNIADDILGASPTPPGPEIVPFATATDAQISALLDAHYRGDIDLSEIWNVGDTRVIHIDALSAPVTGSKKAHVAQDMTFRIIGFKHDNLTTPINGITKAAVTIECKEVLGDNGTEERDGISCSSNGSKYENPLYFNNAYRRTWLNNNFVSALPSTFNTLIKTVVKRNLQGHNNTTSYVETNDKAFLLSYPEVFNSTYSDYRSGAALGDYEGTQYTYYNQNNTNAGRIKYVNNNGSASSTISTVYGYWLRSPSSASSTYWCRVKSDGSANDDYNSTELGLAPALAI